MGAERGLGFGDRRPPDFRTGRDTGMRASRRAWAKLGEASLHALLKAGGKATAKEGEVLRPSLKP